MDVSAILLTKPQSFKHFLVRAFRIAQIAAEPVFIEMLSGFDIPVPARIRGNLVREHDRAIGRLAKLELEVDQLDADFPEKGFQKVVDFERIVRNRVDFLLCRRANGFGRTENISD